MRLTDPGQPALQHVHWLLRTGRLRLTRASAPIESTGRKGRPVSPVDLRRIPPARQAAAGMFFLVDSRIDLRNRISTSYPLGPIAEPTLPRCHWLALSTCWEQGLTTISATAVQKAIDGFWVLSVNSRQALNRTASFCDKVKLDGDNELVRSCCLTKECYPTECCRFAFFLLFFRGLPGAERPANHFQLFRNSHFGLRISGLSQTA